MQGSLKVSVVNIRLFNTRLLNPYFTSGKLTSCYVVNMLCVFSVVESIRRGEVFTKGFKSF